MNDKELADITEQIAKWAKEEPLIANIYLFGSRIRGDFKEYSDLDVAIELDPNNIKNDFSEGGLATWIHSAPAWRKKIQMFLKVTLHLEWYHPLYTPKVGNALQMSSILIFKK